MACSLYADIAVGCVLPFVVSTNKQQWFIQITTSTWSPVVQTKVIDWCNRTWTVICVPLKNIFQLTKSVITLNIACFCVKTVLAVLKSLIEWTHLLLLLCFGFEAIFDMSGSCSLHHFAKQIILLLTRDPLMSAGSWDASCVCIDAARKAFMNSLNFSVFGWMSSKVLNVNTF